MRAQVGVIISLSQVVAMLIERWGELDEDVKAEIAELRGGRVTWCST